MLLLHGGAGKAIYTVISRQLPAGYIRPTAAVINGPPKRLRHRPCAMCTELERDMLTVWQASSDTSSLNDI